MRTEEELVAGVLLLQLGGDTISLRELRIKESRVWEKELVGLVRDFGDIDIATTPAGVTGMLGAVTNLTGNRLIDLVLAYDKDGQIAGREWLEENATSTEIYRAVRKMLESVFPFVQDIQGGLAQVLPLLRAAQLTAESPAVGSAAKSTADGRSPRPRAGRGATDRPGPRPVALAGRSEELNP